MQPERYNKIGRITMVDKTNNGLSFAQGYAEDLPNARKHVSHSGEIVDFVDFCFDDEQEDAQARDFQVMADGIQTFLSWLFRPYNAKCPDTKELASRLYAYAYRSNPDLIEGMTLEQIGLIVSKSKQALSKQVQSLDKWGLNRARHSKTERAINSYRRATQKKWTEKKANEKKSARAEYLQRWNQENRDHKKALNQAYYEANKARLNEAAKQKRAAKRKSGLK